MKHIWYATILGFVLSAPCICVAQSVPPSPAHPPTKHPQGFFDYALGKINSENKDYGAAIADARSEVVAYTMESLYFWSNVVSLALLATTSITLALVLRTRNKRETIAATLITQLWNGRVIDRREIVRRTEMYNALVETRDATVIRTLSPAKEERIEIPASEAVPSKQPGKKTRVLMETGVLRSPSSVGETGAGLTSEPGQNSRLLANQVQALRNSERNLRERLNQVSQDLEQERRRNQTLKGA